jgi:hypothetical protein
MTMTAQAALPKLDAKFRAKARAMRGDAELYCTALAFAQTMREQVDAIAARLLAEECPLYMDLNGRGDRIVAPKDTWLCEDQPALDAYYAAMDRELRAAGLKPDEMEDGYCPALVAEHNAQKLRWAIIDAMAPLVGIDRKQLWGDNEAKFFELVMGLILNA